MGKTLEHNGTRYEIAESIYDMQLGSFLDFCALMNSGADPDDLGHQMKIVHAISGVPMQEIEDMDFAQFDQLAGLCALDVKFPETVTAQEAGVNPAKDPIPFVVEGETYTFQPDYAYTKLRDAMRVEDILRGKDLHTHLPVVLALTAWKEGEIFDPNLISQKATTMQKARMTDVYRSLLFFCAQDRTSSLFTRHYGGKLARAMAQKLTPSLPSGDGTASKRTSLKTAS